MTLEAGENGQANTIKVDVNAQGVVEKAQLPSSIPTQLAIS
ncbi:hypothetical protein [Moraxella ovis]|nr:hypothetical protein [Moraxella ovis]